jgi:hypothetical protein
MFKRIMIGIAAAAAAIVTGLTFTGAAIVPSVTAGSAHSNWIPEPGW